MKNKKSSTREEIESRINFVNSELAELCSEKQSKNEQLKRHRAQLEHVEERLSQKTARVNVKEPWAHAKPGVNEANLTVVEREEFDAARNAVSTTVTAVNELDVLIADKERILAELTKEKSAIVCDSAADEVISFKDSQKQLKREITELQGVIASQEKNISAAEQSIPPVRNLTAKRAEILADIAIGKATQEDLNSIDKQIRTPDDNSAARSQATQAIADANQTISGLRVKLEKAEKELKGLEARWPNVIHDFLTAEAEKIGEDYLQAANNLEASFRRLIALDTILKRQGCGGISLVKAEEILIPAFNLKSHEDKRGKSSYNKSELQLTNTTLSCYNNKRQDDIMTEMNRWKTAGIAL